MADSRWYFTKEEILNSPSRRCGIDAEKELSYRHQGAKLIQDMGLRLQVTQLVINTAIVYMHRFYMFHAFTRFHRNSIGPAALFLAAKVEEQPRKLEHVIKVAHYMLNHHEQTTLDTQSEAYSEKAQELVINENILLQTLGFDVAIDHPHTYVVKCFQMVRSKSPYNDRLSSQASTDLAQTSYLMATNSLHMTTMCLQYKPAVVACVCIYIVCKWSNYEIQRFSEGRDWFCHLDSSVTVEMLDHLTTDFLAVLDKYPNRLKKIMNSGGQSGGSGSSSLDDRGGGGRHIRDPLSVSMRSSVTSSTARSHDFATGGKSNSMATNAPPKTTLSHKEYSEKREKERREREKGRIDLRGVSTGLAHHHPATSSNVIIPNHHPIVSHPRLYSQEALSNMRKPHLDNSKLGGYGVPGKAPPPHPPVNQHVNKEAMMKREVPLRSEDKMGEKHDRTSNSSSDFKVVSDKFKSMETKALNQNFESNKQKLSESFGEMKTVEVAVDSIVQEQVKCETKDGAKSDVPFSTLAEAKDIMKAEPQDIKPSNSFMFNHSFSLRDFLNPSEMPPEDIFDTDSKINITNPEYLAPSPTHHAKLKSPPKPTGFNPLMHPPPHLSMPVISTKDKEKSISKHGHRMSQPATTNSDKSVLKVPKENSCLVPEISSNDNPASVGTNQNEQLVVSKKKDSRILPLSAKNKQTIFSEPKVVLTNISAEEVKQHTKGHVPGFFKEPLPVTVRGEAFRQNLGPTRQISSSEAAKQAVGLNRQKQVIVPISVPDLATAAAHSNTNSLKFKLTVPENCDGNTGVPSNIPSFAHPLQKKHKREHGYHKHKDKKKHKHREKDKDKDKHKNKEHKEHKNKEHKPKVKKHKKHKEHKEKKKVLEDDVTSLKITLFREKERGGFAPETGPVMANSTQSGIAIDTPARIKLTIAKSRIQPNSSLSAPVSPSQSLPPRVKVKVPGTRGEKDSRKRERSPGGNINLAKIPRSSSGHTAPQVLDAAQWSSQRQ